MITLAFGMVGLVLALVALLLIGIPLALLIGLAPWALILVGAVLFFKALFIVPLALKNLIPTAIALGVAALLLGGGSMLMGYMPWIVGLVGVGLLIRALFDKPLTLNSFYPAIIALSTSALLRWIF